MANGFISEVEKIGSWFSKVFKHAPAWSVQALAALNVAAPIIEEVILVADPAVVRDLHTLNLGGFLMRKSRAYEGAAQQTRRLDQAGLIETHLPKLGAVAGGAVTAATGIPGAEIAGGLAGMKGQPRMAASRQMQLAAERDAPMEAAAKAGVPLRDMMK